MPVNCCGTVSSSFEEFINDFIKTKEYVRIDKKHLLETLLLLLLLNMDLLD